MSVTQPTSEQIRFRSSKTGEHTLDTYLEAAEIGNRQLFDLLDDLFDGSNSGLLKTDIWSFRYNDSTKKLQVRSGDASSSYQDITTFFNAQGTFSTSTAYNNFDLVTVANSDVYIVDGLSVGTAYGSESAFTSSANTTKLVDVSGAQTHATAAAASAATATTQAGISTTKAGESATSATASATAKTAAETAQAAAASSNTSAAASATSATASATTATSQATISTTKAAEAVVSAASGATSASTSTAQATISTTKAGEASTSATTSTAQAAISTTKAGEASTSESNAATSKTAAETAKTAAETAQASAESARDLAQAAYDNFDDIYLGAKSSNPSVDNDGNALVAGAMYFNTTTDIMRVYEGSSWVDVYVSGSSVLALSGGTLTGPVTLATDKKVKLRDDAIYINSSADGQLDLVADTEIQIAAPTVDINGAVALDGAITGATNITLTGVLDSAGDSIFSSTGALIISKGTTAQRPTAALGMLRYNSTTSEFEGYSGGTPAWKSVGGSAISNETSSTSNLFPLSADATSGTALQVYTSNTKYLYKPSDGSLQAPAMVSTNGLVVNSATVATSYTIPSGSNAMSIGTMTVSSGATVTVSSGSKWVVI